MQHKIRPAVSFEKLRGRVERLFTSPIRQNSKSTQLSLSFMDEQKTQRTRARPPKKIANFINSILYTMKFGDIYLFGGILRDLALMGRRGFSSDIDLVIDGDWESCEIKLISLKAKKNKFGGYRLEISGWPIDIWDAKKTWAISEGLVKYDNISSLINTTVLNWDAILMNWRTQEFICNDEYLIELKNRTMNIVLQNNPNPLGMAVRVFRHLCSKDARSITSTVVEYLADSTNKYALKELKESELLSYGNSLIEPAIYSFFEKIKAHEKLEVHKRFQIASKELKLQGTTLTFSQFELDLKIKDDTI